MRFTTLKVQMTGNSYYPTVTIDRDGDYWHHGVYGLNEFDMKRIQLLFDSHPGKIYTNLAASRVELLKVKP